MAVCQGMTQNVVGLMMRKTIQRNACPNDDNTIITPPHPPPPPAGDIVLHCIEEGQEHSSEKWLKRVKWSEWDEIPWLGERMRSDSFSESLLWFCEINLPWFWVGVDRTHIQTERGILSFPLPRKTCRRIKDHWKNDNFFGEEMNGRESHLLTWKLVIGLAVIWNNNAFTVCIEIPNFWFIKLKQHKALKIRTCILLFYYGHWTDVQ